VEIRGDKAAKESASLRGAWQADVLPGRQRQLVEHQLAEFRRGAPIDVFDIMLKALRELPESAEGMSLLEVGCSSGYYAELFEIAGIGVVYTGCDYSDAFITMARQKYPRLRFDVGDATSLHYADNEFNIVLSGCCLLHIPEYERAIAETARVAQQFAIFHRTPVVLGQPEKRYRKLAYGVETIEIHFSEPQFLALLVSHRLEPIAVYTLSESVKDGIGDAQRTYVCQKVLA
jgi:SAM-dependent methyltransferase